MTNRIGQQPGNYRLLRLLGSGAFADVYQGEHLYLETPAAIKVLRVQMDAGSQEAFRREAHMLAHVQHPHIVRILDFGIYEQQTPYLVMEYTPNGTLRSRHPKGTRLSFEEIVSAVKQIADALDYAHEQHIIHRDVKPENMLLNARGEVVLSDFGIAVLQRTIASQTTQKLAGTPAYMAPEQIRGKACAASDQYALGVMVYEWLCGELPFQGTLFEVLNQHLHRPPPSLCARVPDLFPAVEDAVFGTLAKDPRQRFVSVQDFATALEEACFATRPLLPRVTVSQDSLLLPTVPLAAQTVRTLNNQGRASTTMLLPTVPDQVLRKAHGPVVRQRLLRRVRSYWVTGVLEQSLHGAALMALGLQEQRHLVADPWQLVFQGPERVSYALPAGTSIVQAYDAADGELFISGAPGSGKTTLLLDLARALLVRAEQDESHPIPVVFNLSSWALKQLPLLEWFVEELHKKYQVPQQLGQALMATDQILPLLDGLDEVVAKERTNCIETINTYHQEHGLQSLVVCSRSADYLAQCGRLLLRSAVMIQPLTPQQVDAYLTRAGKPLQALRLALRKDVSLRELTSTPLMLSILALTYHGMPVEALLRPASPLELRNVIFRQYVERMLTRRGADGTYGYQQTTHWLSWLAGQMVRHNQTEFYIERMQPDWLPGSFLKGGYFGAVVRLGIGLLAGLICCLSIGIATGLLFGAALGARMGLMVGLISGLISGLGGGLVMGMLSRVGPQIQPVEAIDWSWRRPVKLGPLKERLRLATSSSLLISVIATLILTRYAKGPGPLIQLLVLSLGIGLVVSVATLFTSGLTSGISSKIRKQALPNQGIKRSARIGLLSGLLGSWLGGITGMGMLVLVLSLDPRAYFAHLFLLLFSMLLFGAFVGTISGLIIGLDNGGIACIQHLVLRLFLRQANVGPWNYARFLDYASERILLHKVGGGYIFVHRLLLEYFATLENWPDERAGKNRRGNASGPYAPSGTSRSDTAVVAPRRPLRSAKSA